MARVLLMDDDALLREAVTRGLDRGGHSVHQAENGRDGFAVLEEHRSMSWSRTSICPTWMASR